MNPKGSTDRFANLLRENPCLLRPARMQGEDFRRPPLLVPSTAAGCFILFKRNILWGGWPARPPRLSLSVFASRISYVLLEKSALFRQAPLCTEQGAEGSAKKRPANPLTGATLEWAVPSGHAAGNKT